MDTAERQRDYYNTTTTTHFARMPILVASRIFEERMICFFARLMIGRRRRR